MKPNNDEPIDVKYFKWADEPPTPLNRVKKRPESVYHGIVRKLKKNNKNRGRWALVRKNVGPTTQSRLNKMFPEIHWTVRKNQQGTYDLWASWPLPEESHQLEGQSQSGFQD